MLLMICVVIELGSFCGARKIVRTGNCAGNDFPAAMSIHVEVNQRPQSSLKRTDVKQAVAAYLTSREVRCGSCLVSGAARARST